MPSTNYITLELNFDEHPSEVGWFLVADKGDALTVSRCDSEDTGLVAFGPRQPYWEGLAYKQVMERIMLPDMTVDRRLTLTVYDTGRDGLCCNGTLALHTGESTIIASDFKGERFTFNVRGGSTLTSSPSCCAVNTASALVLAILAIPITMIG